jgi:hypothetical protein
MSYVTHQKNNAYVTAGPLARVLSSFLMRDGFGGTDMDSLESCYCLDATDVIVSGSTSYNYTVGTTLEFRG